MRAVTVPADPVFNSILLAPSDYWYFVVLVENKFTLRINATLVILPPICSVDSACNRSSCEYLCFHPYGTFNKTVLFHPPNGISLLGKAPFFCTVVTNLLVRTQKFFRIFGGISLATLLRDSYFFCVHVNMARIASIAATSSIFAVYDDLRRYADIWPCFVSRDINPIGKDTSWCFYPTGTTVVWRSLIFGPRQIVYSWNVTPIPTLWDIFEIKVFIWPWRADIFR